MLLDTAVWIVCCFSWPDSDMLGHVLGPGRGCGSVLGTWGITWQNVDILLFKISVNVNICMLTQLNVYLGLEWLGETPV